MINLKELKQSLSRMAELQAQRAEEYRMSHLLHEDTKFKFAYLGLEITRKCNLKCAHCLRGDAQNLSMSTAVIDKILDSSAGIKEIFFTGGEPFLEPDLIEYVVDQVIERDFECFGMAVITNGTIMNDNAIRCIKALNKFAEWSRKKYGDIAKCRISISNDHFHDQESSTVCMEFYKPYAGEFLELIMHGDISDDRLVKAGRAVQTGVAESDFRKFHALPRRVYINEYNAIGCMLELSAQGNLYLPEYNSWKDIDANSIGNIMNESLVKIFERNQWKELCCTEIKKIGKNINSFYDEKEVQEQIIETYKTFKNFRYRMHIRYPYLDYYEIYMLTSYLLEQETDGDWLKHVLRGYDKDIFTPEFLRQAIDDLITVNDIRKNAGKPKVQLVPYNPDINHIDGCTDLDEQS